VGDCAYPVFFALEELTANGENIEHDDTHVKIQDVMKDNKLNPNKERTGMYTTCIKGTADGHPVCLYYTGTQHGGENVGQLLSKRNASLPPIRQMCDALAANVAKEYKTILCNCLTHGRRKFKEIELDFPEECHYVLEQFGLVYKHDAATKALNMSATERLAYHQEHSLPVMNDLWHWMQKQFDERLVEPNSGLGKAINYMKNHWEKLTRFLSVAGALIDNNLVEQALKLIIRIRKNSMFHKSEHGAFVAAMLLSLIATCELAGKNPVHYLTELQKNKSFVFKQPHLWFPWNYEATIHDTEQIAQQTAA
jgi:transposase